MDTRVDPVPLHRVSESFQPGPLPFRLPVELLVIVVDFLHASAYNNLALVGRNYYRIARSRQFSKLDIRSLQAAEKQIWRLHDELDGSQSPTSLPGVGSYVRHITVALTAQRNPPELPYTTTHSRSLIILQALASLIHHGLPRLETFYWDRWNQCPMPITLARSLLRSRIRRLYLTGFMDSRCYIEDWRADVASNETLDELPLIRLDLSPSGTHLATRAWGPLPCWNFLVQSTAALQHLSIDLGSLYDVILPPGSKQVRLHQLKILQIRPTWDTINEAFFDILLPRDDACHVHTLAIHPGPTWDGELHLVEWVALRGHIPSLRKLIWRSDSVNYAASVLKVNPQIQELLYESPPSDDADLHTLYSILIDRALSSSLTTLTIPNGYKDGFADGLETTWEFWETVMDSLSGFRDLKHLSIGAEITRMAAAHDATTGLRAFDHGLISSRLARLTKLQSLAFGYDTYRPVSQVRSNRYYQILIPSTAIRGPPWYHGRMSRLSRYLKKLGSDKGEMPLDERFVLERRVNETGYEPKAWEVEHRERMTVIAKTYFEWLPALSWLYVGQLVFTRGSGTSPLCNSTRRDVPLDFIRQTFDIEG